MKTNLSSYLFISPLAKSSRKIFSFVFVTLLLSVCSYHAEAQQWVSFGNSLAPKAPEIILISATNSQVVYTCEAFGFYQTDVTVDERTYQRITMPGVSNNNQTGYPDLPNINRAVAYAGKLTPTVTVNVTKQLQYRNYLIYPAPAIVDTVICGNFPYLAEVFAINSLVYDQNSLIPFVISEIASSGRFREQQYINVVTNPLQWNPVSTYLTANVKCTVTVNLGNGPETEIKNTGIFNSIASGIFINYPKKMVVDATSKTGVTRDGSIEYYTLADPGDADDIVADYLIIADQQFFEPNNPNSELRRIAEHRATYNGYKVAIVNAQNIMSDAVGFPYERYPYGDDYKYKNERRIREFIKHVYENGLAPHTYDGHLAYVLLVGDSEKDTTGAIPTKGIPGSHDPYDYRNPFVYLPNTIRYSINHVSDYYYACITHVPESIEYDDIGDLYVGRFSVDSIEQLHNMVEKTIHYETDYDFVDWKERSFFFNSTGIGENDTSLVYTYLAGINGFYNNFIPNRISSPYTYTIKDLHYTDSYNQIDTVMKFFNRGHAYTQYYGHSDVEYMKVGMVYPYLNSAYLKAHLENTGKYGFMFMNSCNAGIFDIHNNVKCMAEDLTQFSDSLGFVGILAASTKAFFDYSPGVSPQLTTIPDFLLDGNYAKLAHIVGESILQAKIKKQFLNSYWTDDAPFYYNLLGDPGLNLRNQGFFVSKNTVLDENVTIADSIHVLSGVTLSLPNNCRLYFENNGRLIIDSGAFISFQDSASFYGREMVNALEIRGGIKTKANCLPTINFEAPEGMSCSGLVFENPALEASFKKLNFTRAAISANQLLSLNIESTASAKSCFNYSPLYLQSKNILVSNTIFKNASYMYCNRTDESGENVNISYCAFIPTATQPTNALEPSIYLEGYKNFDIQNNTITFNSGDGISLYKTGLAATLKNIKNNVVTFNGTTYYNNNGIKVVQSNVNIEKNTITNAKYGVSIFNNCVVSLLGNGSATTASQTQQIYNNTEYQVYVADKGSFPVPFRYNYINNQSTNALVYCAGLNIPASSLDVRCNNWGSSFIPTQDLFPNAAYQYSPVWNFGSFCSGGIALTMNAGNENTTEAISDFLKKLSIDDTDTPENLASLSELASDILSKREDVAELKTVLADLMVKHAGDELGERAKNIENRLYISSGDFNVPIRCYEQRLISPKSLADSVYAAIELAQTMLLCGEGNTNHVKSASIYQNLLPENENSFFKYKEKLIDLLYLKEIIKKAITKDAPERIEFTLSPNPASEMLTITFTKNVDSPVAVSIADITGRLVFSDERIPNKAGNKVFIDVSVIPSGTYVIQINKVSEKPYQKLIITR